MNKTIIKHISIMFFLSLFFLFVWFLFIYIFFDNELKKTIYPIIDESKQMLSDIVNKNFAPDKTKKFISELKENEYIGYLSIKNEENSSEYSKIKSFLLSALKLSYPIKHDKKIVGWVEVWPSYMLFSKMFSDRTNIAIFLLSVISLLSIFIWVVYVYIKRYIFGPFKQIKIMINNIVSNKELNIDESIEYGIWKNVLYDLKKLHNKVFDINTTMNLLFSATSIISSDLELVNSIHALFNIVQKRIKDSMCALFIPNESGQLKVFTKNGLLNNDIMFISQNNDNYIWNTYLKTEEIIINTKDKIVKENLGELYDGNIGSLMTVPLMDEKEKCIGVFVIVSKTEESFNPDNIDVINSVSKYLVALINRMKDYQKIKETNRKLEIEVETASKELIETNNVLVKKIKDIRTLSDIALYSANKTSIDDCMEYIMSNTKELLDVEKFGVFQYDNKKNCFSSVQKSFDLKESLNFSNKKGTIYSDIVSKGKNVIVNNSSDLGNNSENVISDIVKLKSAIFLPIKKENNVIAIIAAVNKKNSDFNLSDIKILEHISVIIYGIIDKMALYNKLNNNIKMGEANGNG